MFVCQVHKRKRNFTAKTFTEQLDYRHSLLLAPQSNGLRLLPLELKKAAYLIGPRVLEKKRQNLRTCSEGGDPGCVGRGGLVDSREQRNRRGLSTCQVSITHHLAIAGHPGLDRPNHSVTSQAAVTQQLFPHPKQFKRRVVPPKIHPLGKGLGVSW